MTTLPARLREHAVNRPNRLAYRHLVDGDVDGAVETLTFGELHSRAQAVAAALHRSGARPGDRALLLYDGGMQVIVAIAGCFAAGVIAVPTYPPDPRRVARTLPRLQSIAEDAGAGWVLTTSALRASAQPICAEVEALEPLVWIATDAVEDGEVDVEVAPSDIAYLQYTSGSTGTPKGVEVTHDNLFVICQDMLDRWPYDDDSHQISWLPTFHDLGLIWGLLTPLLGGFDCTFLSPVAFVTRPRRWLEAITAFGGTTTAAPDFGYALCVRKVDSLDGLDLSTLRAAMNAAEPVRATTIRAFADAFAPVGFRPEVMCPWYGLAEGTLQVTLSTPNQAPTIYPVSGPDLAQDRVVPGGDVEAVGNGVVVPGSTVAIVHPETRERTTGVGEIWVSGPSVAAGYWNNPEATQETFRARIVGEDTDWLRTGDLGFVRGELFVTGRLKDLIILHGRNVYPQDIEVIAEGVHPAVRPGCGAAFALDVDGEEKVGLVVEIDTRKIDGGPETLLTPIREAVAAGLDVPLHTLVLIPPRTVPKTSSGKIQRRRARQALLSGALTPLASSEAAARPTATPRGDLGRGVDMAPARRRPKLVQRWLTKAVGRLVGRDDVEVDTPFWDLGLDSVSAVQLAEQLSEALDQEVPATALFDHATIEALAAAVIEWR